MPIERTLRYISPAMISVGIQSLPPDSVEHWQYQYERAARVILDGQEMLAGGCCPDCDATNRMLAVGLHSIATLRANPESCLRTIENAYRRAVARAIPAPPPVPETMITVDRYNPYSTNSTTATMPVYDSTYSIQVLNDYEQRKKDMELAKVRMQQENEAKLAIRARNLKLNKRQLFKLNRFNQMASYDLAMLFLDSIEGKRMDSSNRAWLRNYKFQVPVRAQDKFISSERGRILEMLKAKFDPKTPKAPGMTSLGQWIGVEIECFIPYDSFGIDFDDYDDDSTDDGSPSYEDADSALTRMLKQRRIKNVQSKTDGSINPGDTDERCFTVEFCVLFTMQDRSNLKELCKLLRDLDARVNRSCGLHVHLDMRDVLDLDPEQLESARNRYRSINTRKAMTRAYRLKHALPLLTQMVPPSRRNNTYCRLDISQNDDRYYAINTTSLRKFGTLEVRLHSGTTEYSKISSWVDLLYNLSRSPKLTRHEVYSPEQLSERLPDLDVGLMEYVKDRIKKFSKFPIVQRSQQDRVSFISIDDESDSGFDPDGDFNPSDEDELDESVSF